MPVLLSQLLPQMRGKRTLAAPLSAVDADDLWPSRTDLDRDPARDLDPRGDRSGQWAMTIILGRRCHSE
ncbi:MAG: hypothetical protein ACREUE_09090, partial [Panacagrimonas sp.]